MCLSTCCLVAKSTVDCWIALLLQKTTPQSSPRDLNSFGELICTYVIRQMEGDLCIKSPTMYEIQTFLNIFYKDEALISLLNTT